MDIRKWIQLDGFDTNFLVELASQADETTTSVVTESSVDSSPVDPSQEEIQMDPPTQVQSIVETQPSTSTPVPALAPGVHQSTPDNDLVTGLIDEVRQLSIAMADLKAENEALASKIQLRELEQRDLQKLIDELQQNQDKSEEEVKKAYRLIYKTGLVFYNNSIQN